MVTVSLEKIIQALSEERPCGHNLREAKDASLHLYHTVKDFRHNARLNENQNAAAGETNFIKRSDWESVLEKSYDILLRHSKDVEVASWFVEALVRIDSFQGLALGIKTLSELFKRYPNFLHPQAEKGGSSEGDDWNPALAFLSGLFGSSGHDGTLFTPIRCAPFTKRDLFCLWQFQKAYELENTNEKKLKEEKIRNGAPTLKSIQNDILESDSSFLADTKKHIEDCIAHIEELSLVLDEKFKNNSISISATKGILSECQRAFVFLAGDRLEFMLEETSKGRAVEESNEQKVDQVIEFPFQKEKAENPYKNCEKLLAEINFDCIFNPQNYNAPFLKGNAIKLIHYLSQIMKVTDSLSPLPYFLDKAVHVSTLSFAQALSELQLKPHDISSSTFTQLTGIQLGEDKTTI
ncbi:MAG: type VI secretion system ImpA family N-terminal domain-containing protein [Bdellovibrionota bacterium]